MPTRLRVDLDRSVIFNNHYDKNIFLQIINKSATIHKVTLHDYCIMDKHYHLLIETQKSLKNILWMFKLKRIETLLY